MENFKGTKGNWESNGYPRLTVQSPSGEICLINPNMPNDEDSHNTKLIAASPDLLEVTQKAYALLSPISNQWEGRETHEGQYLLASMKSAIQKATL
ncbi:MAG: hypothetical protein JXQ96_23625 [Cyclobacteriaceae bacterium]